MFVKKSIVYCKKYSSFKELKSFLLNLSRSICNFYQNQLHGINRNTSAFFQHIKTLLPEHIAFVDAIADILNISNDSAYRRIRGEKHISLEEMQKLAAHYKISLDQFMHLQSQIPLFLQENLQMRRKIFWRNGCRKRISNCTLSAVLSTSICIIMPKIFRILDHLYTGVLGI